MIGILPVDVMRQSDAAAIAAGTPGEELMRRAGEGIFRAGTWEPPVAVVCGTGNNAGDGYVLAGLLAERGIDCEILLQAERFTPDGGTWFNRCREKKIPVRLWRETGELDGYNTIADCIFGTGFHGTAEGEAADMIRKINRSGARVISADINSGLNGKNGLAELAVRSDLTVSVGSYQPGHFLNMAKDFMKARTNCDIGIPPAGRQIFLAEAADAATMYPPRKHFSHKGDYGYLALIGGSLRYSGAIRLAGIANCAMRGGAGVVRICAPESLCRAMVPEVLESTLFPLSEENGTLRFREEEFREALRGTKAAAFGMGIGHTEETRKAVRFLLREYKGVLILDADGLNALADEGAGLLKGAGCRTLVTPHLGEFARLSGKTIQEIREDPVGAAEAFAAETGATVLLKGPATVVTDGTETWITDRGCPGMATAGSGDVLSGVLAAVCAANSAHLVQAAAAGAWLNGRAGELAQEKHGDASMLASDTAAALEEALREIRRDAGAD